MYSTPLILSSTMGESLEGRGSDKEGRKYDVSVEGGVVHPYQG